jgi:hypothetical protein
MFEVLFSQKIKYNYLFIRIIFVETYTLPLLTGLGYKFKPSITECPAVSFVVLYLEH